MARKTTVAGIELSYVLGGLLAASVLAFYATRNSLFAIVGFLLLVALFVRDILPSKWSRAELVSTGKELAIALLLALGVWLAMQFFLGTQAPIDVVTSCSMLPNLERGDMIVVQGSKTPQATLLVFSGSLEDLQQELRVNKNACTVRVSGSPVQALCTNGIFYRGTEFIQRPDSDVVVYDASPRFYGLIVHRVFVRLSNGTNEYLLTKGDNNIGLDQEAGLLPVQPKDVRGTVITRIPLLGFLKLFLFMQFDEPAGCKQVLQGGN